VAADTIAEQIVFAATAADVRQVIVGGRTIVEDRRHVDLPDVPGALERALAAALDETPPRLRNGSPS